MRCKCLLSLIMSLGIASGQTGASSEPHMPDSSVDGYWLDKTTGLSWANKDNGDDANWHTAAAYCKELRVAGYTDWRLATIDELWGIFDKAVEAPGQNPASRKHGTEAIMYHVKGKLFLTGDSWSSSQVKDDRGLPSGLVWYFDFFNGRRKKDDAGRFTGRLAKAGKRALCVRNP